MVALLTRLQLTLTRRGFRGSGAKIVGLVILSLYAALLLVLILSGLWFLRSQDVAWIGAITTLGFSFVTLMWPILMVLFGSNEALSPSRFALLPVRAGDLQPGLLVATVLTLGGIITFVLTLGFVMAWSASPLTLAAAIPCGVAGLLFAMLATRTLTAAISATLASRKFRDWIVVLVGLLAMASAFSGQLIGYLFEGGSQPRVEQFEPTSVVLGWTPLGWAWSVPWDIADGAWLSIVVKGVCFAAVWWGLWTAWGRFLDRALTSPLEAGGGAAKIKESGRIDRLMPATPAGAIGARTIRYWLRDPRRKVQAMAIIILPVVLAFALPRDGGGIMLLAVMPGTLLLVGLSLVMAEICYDGSAIAEQILCGTRGVDDRWGRLYGLGIWLVPISVLATLGFVAWTGYWRYAAVTVGLTLGVLATMAGIGSWAGAMWNYPVPPSGVGMNSRGNLGAIGGMLLSTLVALVLVAPMAALAVAAGFYPVLLWVSPVASLAVGALICWGGAVLGGRYLDRRWPEVLKSITWDKP